MSDEHQEHIPPPVGGEDADARFVVIVSTDRMRVDLQLISAAVGDGRQLDVEWLIEELEEKKISFGFDSERLEKTLAVLGLTDSPGEEAAEGIKNSDGSVCLAEGRYPVEGSRGWLKFLVGPDAVNSDPVAAWIVRPGQAVVRRIPATPGRAGCNVFGEEIAAKEYKDAELNPGENCSLSEDGLDCIAEVYGRAEVAGNLVSVVNLVAISPGEMAAWLPVYPFTADETPLEYEHIAQSLEHNGVVFGIQEESILAALEQRIHISRLLVAKGEPPQKGQDARLSFHFTLNDQDPLQVDKTRQAGKLRERKIRKSLITGGSLLVEKTPPVAAVPGHKVTGEPISAREGEDIELSAGDNVLSDNDGLKLSLDSSLVAGYPDYRQGVVLVDDPIEIAEDKLSAFMDIHPPDNAGRKLSPEIIIKMLAGRQISRGVMKKSIRRAVEFSVSERRVLRRVLIARGKPAENGADGRIEMKRQPLKHAGRISDPVEQIDFRERDAITTVKKDEVIATRYPPGEGVDGYTVQGDFLPAKPGADIQFQPQANVRVSEDGLHLISEIDGMLSVSGPNKIAVFEVFEVKGDLDYKLGNLDMAGALLISGWVRPGFTLKASGDIRVGGGVEDSVLISGADVLINGGMISRGQGRISAANDVAVNFLEWSRVNAGGNVMVKDQILRSQVFADGTLSVLGGRGRIRGGFASAIQGIEAEEVGSPAGVRTVLMAGNNPALRRRVLRIEQKLLESARRQAKLDTVLGRWLGQGRGAAASRMPIATQRKLAVLAKERRGHLQEERRLRSMKEKLQQELEMIDLSKIKIVVNKSVHAGTVVIIGQVKYKVRDELNQRVSFRYEKERHEIVRS